MTMRSLEELINDAESALPLVLETIQANPERCVMHLSSSVAADVLYQTQVTTRSPMGAIAYHSGGISLLGNWLRILGSGSAAIPRTLADWNDGRSSGFYLIADDAFGGFFALDGGALGDSNGQVFYFCPRSLQWLPMGGSYTQFLLWACSDFGSFYDDMTWSGCENVIANLSPDRCLFFYPPLWTVECAFPPLDIRDVPVSELWTFQMEAAQSFASS